ncbi:ribosome recycling factor [Patescibacteria group bacterium]|nr:ribosome recycling factor [Patescibacteria group bacterium]
MSTHLDQHRSEFQGVIEHFQRELQGLRTGRASVQLVENIRVEAYGQSMDLKGVASLTTPDAKTIQIEPWDKTIVKDIEKAIIDASLGLQPNTAGTVIRLVMPQMTEESRKNLVKILRQKSEDARIGIRNVREKIKTLITDDEKEKNISEDDRKRFLEQLDKSVAEQNAIIESITDEKEEEILKV